MSQNNPSRSRPFRPEWLFGALSLGLFCVGFSQALSLRGWEDRSSGVRVDPPVVDMGELPHEGRFEAVFRLTNQSGRTVRLVGAQDICRDWGCMINPTFPPPLAPGESGDVRVHVNTTRGKFSGAFKGDLVVYTDLPGGERIHLWAEGRILPKPASSE